MVLNDPILRKAVLLAGKAKYDEAVKVLEAEVFRFRDSYSYCHLLGVICLYAGDFGGAFSYFNKAKNIKFRSPPALLGLAALFLRRGETGKALDMYLDIRDMEPENRTAKKALEIIRRYSGDRFAAWLETGKLSSLYPPLPRAGIVLKPRPFIIAGLVLAAAAGIGIGIRQAPVFERKGSEAGALEEAERNNPVEPGGSYRYALTRDEVLASYREARSLFNKYRDEAAKRELNRILESNASAAVKNKARLLKSYTAVPGFDTLKDRFTYKEVAADPLLYRDCFVLWRGSAANVSTTASAVQFDFLVGYDTRTVMEGAVAVELAFPAEINPVEPLEVLGRVVPAGPGRFTLAGTAIHQSPVN